MKIDNRKKILCAFFACGLVTILRKQNRCSPTQQAKNRAFRSNSSGLQSKPCGISAAIAGAPRAAAALTLMLLVTGCASLVEKAGRALDGSAFAERELAVYHLAWAGGFTDAEGEPPDEETGSVEVRRLLREEDGGEFLAISPGTLPGLRINGTLPGENGEFHLISLDFFCSNIMGWNSFTMEISGAGVFLPNGEGALLKLDAPVEAVNIIRGKIRRDETRLTGEDALTVLRNRQERISVLCEWMRGPDTPRFRNQAEFENYWQPILLPEMLPPDQRPPAWTEQDAEWSRGEDVSWNASYTRARFPEALWKIRDSGTLLRDWEEAIDWIYFMYLWDDLFCALSNEMNLKGVR